MAGERKTTVKILGDPSGANRAFDAAATGAKGFFDKVGSMGAGLANVLGAAGVVAGAALTKGMFDAIDIGATQDKFAARLGLDPDEAARLGALAGGLYAGAYGESLADVNEVIQNIVTESGEAFGDLSDADLSNLTAQAIDIGAAFDTDVNGAVKTASQLVKNGLVPDMASAFDVITRGFQGTGVHGEEVLETLNEYAETFSSLGIDGPTALGLIDKGLENGAFSADKVGDAFKEFAIRAIDGSSASSDAFASMGLDGETMGTRIANGGDDASAALSETLQALMSIEDPLARDAAGVALFGATWEDLGPQVIAGMDPATIAIDDMSTAAEDMGNTLNDNVAVKIEAFKRRGLQALATLVADYVIPAFERLVDWVSRIDFDAVRARVEGFAAEMRDRLLPAFEAVSRFITDTAIPAFRAVFDFLRENPHVVAGIAGVIGTVLVAALVGAAVALWGVVTAQYALIATWLVLNAPLIATAAAIGLLAAAAVYAYTHFETFRDVVDTMADAVIVAVGWAAEAFQLLFDKVVEVVTPLVAFVGAMVDAVSALFRGEWSAALGAALEAFGHLFDAVVAFLSEFTLAFVKTVAVWALKLVAWIAPMVPVLLLELGKLLLSLIGWILTDAIPWVALKMADLALEFFEWVPGAIVSLVGKLGELWLAVNTWFVTQLLPGVAGKVAGLVVSFGRFAIGVIAALPGQLASVLSSLVGWFTGTVYPTLLAAAGAMARSIGEFAVSFIRSLPGWAASMLSAIVGVVSSWWAALVALGGAAARKIGEGLSGLKDRLVGIVSAAWEAVKGFVRKLNPLSFPGGGVVKGIANMFMAPHGGIMPAMGPVMSDGKHRLAGVMPGELILNAAQQSNIARQLSDRGAASQVAEPRPFGGGGAITINVQQLDPQVASREIAWTLENMGQRL